MFEDAKEKFRSAMVKARAHDFMGFAIDATGGLIAAAIGIGLIASTIFFSVNTTAWDTTSKTVWPYIFVLVVVVILFGLLQMARKRSGSEL
jgi:hypothetical protein